MAGRGTVRAWRAKGPLLLSHTSHSHVLWGIRGTFAKSVVFAKFRCAAAAVLAASYSLPDLPPLPNTGSGGGAFCRIPLPPAVLAGCRGSLRPKTWFLACSPAGSPTSCGQNHFFAALPIRDQEGGGSEGETSRGSTPWGFPLRLVLFKTTRKFYRCCPHQCVRRWAGGAGPAGS